MYTSRETINGDEKEYSTDAGQNARPIWESPFASNSHKHQGAEKAPVLPVHDIAGSKAWVYA